MCVKNPSWRLEPRPLPPSPQHLTSAYTCGVTIAPRVYGGTVKFSTYVVMFILLSKIITLNYNQFCS